MENALWQIDLLDLKNPRAFIFNDSKSIIINKFRNIFGGILSQIEIYPEILRIFSQIEKSEGSLKGNKILRRLKV